jgi:hypothetical protein
MHNFNFIDIICGGLYKIGYGTLSHIPIGLYGNNDVLHFLRRIIFENVCSIMYIELGKLLKKD